MYDDDGDGHLHLVSPVEIRSDPAGLTQPLALPMSPAQRASSGALRTLIPSAMMYYPLLGASCGLLGRALRPLGGLLGPLGALLGLLGVVFWGYVAAVIFLSIFGSILDRSWGPQGSPNRPHMGPKTV